MGQQGGGSSRTTGWVLILIFFLCNVVIGLIQYHSNIVLFFAELISGLVGALLSALQVFPDLLVSLRSINLFRWIRYLRSSKWIYLIGLITLLISMSLNVILYLDKNMGQQGGGSSRTTGSRPSYPTVTPTSVPRNTSLPSPQTVTPSPSPQGNTPPAPVSSCNPPEDGTVNDLTTQTSTYILRGHGCGNTQPFKVGTNWSLAISCTSSIPFEIYVGDYSADGKIISRPIEGEICTSPGDCKKEGSQGIFYLQINAKDDISWEIQIDARPNTCSNGS